MKFGGPSVNRRGVKDFVPNFVFGKAGVCTYCGEYATDVEHVIPLSSYQVNFKRKSNSHNKGIRTFSCRDCNAFLGSKVFKSFVERVMHVRDHWSRKSRKTARTASWTDEEINELKGSLRGHVRALQEKNRQMDRRLEWPFSPKFYRNIQNLVENEVLDPEEENYLEWASEYFHSVREPWN